MLETSLPIDQQLARLPDQPGVYKFYDAKGALLYVGKAGTGFTNTMILELARLLKPITLAKSPLSRMPDRKNKIDK